MTETSILLCFLLFAFSLAPLMTKAFYLGNSRAYSLTHKLTLLALVCAFAFNTPALVFTWPAFCAYGFLLYLKRADAQIFSLRGAASCIPFAFSLISAAWFVAGTLNLHLLGYEQTWSYYAALHGAFLGWIFIGCLAHLASRRNSSQVYLYGSYLFFGLFLLVAYGINGIPYIKRIGVIGFSLAAPLLIGHYAFTLKKSLSPSRIFSLLSFFAIAVSMTFALLNEFWVDFPRSFAGLPTMVLTHGALNALISVPCFYFAIKFEGGSSTVTWADAQCRHGQP